MRLHQREKTFGLPARTLTAADRGRIMQSARDYNDANRKPRQHNGPLTHATLLVLQALLFTFHHQVSGQCFPSYEAIAAQSGVHRSTVAHAIAALEVAGILTWSHRIARGWKRVRNALTGRLERTQQVVRRSNAYVFRVPPAPATDASAQDARRHAKRACRSENPKSGNRSGPNSNPFYNRKPTLNRPAMGMSDGLKAALDRLRSRIQAKSAPG